MTDWIVTIVGPGVVGLTAVDRDRDLTMVMTACDGYGLDLADLAAPQDVAVGFYDRDPEVAAGQGCIGLEFFDSIREAIDFNKPIKKEV